MKYNKFSFIRNLARKIGLIKLLTSGQRLRNKERETYYLNNKPKFAEFVSQMGKFKIHVGDSYEWVRTQSFYDDLNILNHITNNIKTGDCFWDVGTSIGLYSIYVAGFVGDAGLVESFEPEIRSRNRLNENIAFNNLTNIKVNSFALSNQNGKLTMELSEKPSAGNHKILEDNETTNQEIQVIDMFTGDYCISNGLLRIPSVIKIDVEGHEELVIDGCKEIIANSNCKKIICEIHFAILNKRNDSDAVNRILNKLTVAGFNSIKWIDSSHLLAEKL